MGTIQCTACGRSWDESTASFGETGLICEPCARGEVARDAAQMQAAVDRGIAPPLDEIPTSGRHVASAAVRSASHEALEARGARVEVSTVSSQSSIQGVTVNERTGVREVWTLPAAPSVQATFGAESFFTRLKKIFSSELQVGDAAFDDAVYVQTSTPDATRAWLSSGEVRAALIAVARGGDAFEVVGNTVTGVVWEEHASADTIAWLTASLA
jgi:hypothetical protein